MPLFFVYLINTIYFVVEYCSGELYVKISSLCSGKFIVVDGGKG